MLQSVKNVIIDAQLNIFADQNKEATGLKCLVAFFLFMPNTKTTTTKKTTKKEIVKKAVEKKVIEPKFHIVLETGGKVYEMKTDHIAEAILGLDLKTTNTKTKITVKTKDKEAFYSFNVPVARRLFRNSFVANALENRLRIALNDK